MEPAPTVDLSPRKPRLRGALPTGPLSPRQRQVVALVAQGKLNKEIAFELGLSEESVKTYTHDIFRKTGVRNRTELTLYAIQNNLTAVCFSATLTP